MTRKLISVCATVALAASCNVFAQKAAPPAKADVIFTHGNVYTGAIAASSALGSTTRAEAIAVRGDRIMAVGSREEIAKMKGPQTKVIDL
ncbi:MAG: hypothetical protein WCC32_14145, partial [Terriglobales bacterium]